MSVNLTQLPTEVWNKYNNSLQTEILLQILLNLWCKENEMPKHTGKKKKKKVIFNAWKKERLFFPLPVSDY